MSIDFTGVAAVTIPEGNVTKITRKSNGAVLWEKSVPEPDEPTINYLEYIQNTTNANYVDTGIKPNQNTVLTVTVEALDTLSYRGVGGCRDNSYSFCFFTDVSTWRADYNKTNSVTTVAVKVGEKMKLSVGAHKFKINDANQFDYSTTISFSVSQNIWLLGVNNRGSKMNAMNQKFYSAQIEENGVLLRDFKPAKDPSGTTCMYESVERKYYYLNGTNVSAV